MHRPSHAVRLRLGTLVLACAFASLGAAPSEAEAEADESAVLRGAGGTLPYPLYVAWAEAYRLATGRQVRYDAVGSLAGIDAVLNGSADFGASEVALTAAELRRRELDQFPAVVGAVVPVVNIAGVALGGLTLSGDVLANIYLGKIRRWDDAAIAALNPGLALPAQNISVVYRADASGSTFVWSRFLGRSNADWKRRFGAASVVDWPAGLGEYGSEGMASSVQRIKASIGYVEYAYARSHALNVVSLAVAGTNGPAKMVAGMASYNDAVFDAVDEQSAVRPDVDAKLETSGDPAWITNRGWPIMAPTYILFRTVTAGKQTASRVADFFSWAWRSGSSIAEGLGYAALPPTLTARTEREWRRAGLLPAAAPTDGDPGRH